MCAGYAGEGGHGSCHGDSGGPLVYYNTRSKSYVQIGIVAGSISGCGDQNIPGIFGRVDYQSNFDFIHSVITKGIFL